MNATNATPAPSADAFLDEPTPPKADDYLDAPSQPVSATPKPVADDFLDQPGTQERAQQLAADSSVDTAAHAAANPEDYEAAFQAQQLRDNRSLGQKALGVGRELVRPSNWGNAAVAGAKFAAGTVTAPMNFFGGMWHRGLAATARGFGADDLADSEEGKQLRDKAEAVLAGQNVEESLKSAGRGIAAWRPFTGAGGISGENEGIQDLSPEADAAANEARARSEFAARVQAANNAGQLAQGRPLQGGVVAAITGATGTPVSELTPEALQQAGAPPVRPLMVDTEAAAANPENLMLAAAPELPGATYVGGKLTQGVGKVLQVPGRIAESIPGRIGRMTSGPTAAGITAAETAIHTPVLAAKLAAGVGSARGLQWLGKALDEQGGAMASGAPSALDTAAANARLNGTGSVLADTQRVIGDAASRGAATAVGMAPANLALSGGDPEDFARQTAGAAAFGGVTDLLRSARPALVEAARPALRQKGLESQDLNTTEGRQSAQFVQGLPDAQRNTTLELQGALAGLPVTNAQGQQVPARMIVLPDAAYNATVQKLAGNSAPEGGGQGFFWTPDGTAYINGEHSQLQSGSGFAQVAGHEFAGHAAMNMLQAMGAKGGPIYDGIVNSAKAALYNPDGTPTPDFQAFVDNYNRSFDPTGQHKQIDPENQNSIDEFLAETAGRIISQRGAADIALPPSLLDRVTQGVGTFMAGVAGVDPRSVGNGRFGQKEVADLSGAVRDSLIQLAGAKLRPGEGEGAISRPQTPEEYVQELQETLAKPRPTDTAENVRAWLKEQAQARKDLADFQGQPTAAPSRPPPPPSAPVVPPNPARVDAIKGMVSMGIKSPEATKFVDAAAQALGGSPSASDLLTAATKLRGGGKVNPTPNVPAETATQTQPLPEGATVATAGDEPAPAPAAPVQDEPAAGVAVGTPDEVGAKAEADAIAQEKYGRANTGAGKKRVQDAKIQALAEAGKQSPNDLHVVMNATGDKSLVGDINPENPYHAAILKELGISADDIKGVTDAQGLAGTPAYIRYRSAKSDTEGIGGEGTAETIGSASKRAAEIDANPAEDRKESTIQHKVAIPLDTSITKSGGVAKRFLVLSDLLHNAQSIFEWMKAKGITNPFGETPDEQQQGLVADAQAHAKNHANGWNGPGTAPLQGFPDTGFPPLNPDYQPTVIPKERFDVLNAMFNDEKAVKVGDRQAAVEEKKARVDAAKTPGAKRTAQGVYERAVDALRQSEELQNLNRENGSYHDPASNETNELRKQMKDSGFDPKDGFYSVIQNLSPDHILGVSDQPIPHQPGDVDSIRPSGFDIDPAELAKDGLPNQKAIAAGFSPSDNYLGITDDESHVKGAKIRNHPTGYQDINSFHDDVMPVSDLRTAENRWRYANGNVYWMFPETDVDRMSVEHWLDKKGQSVDGHRPYSRLGKDLASPGFSPDEDQKTTFRSDMRQQGDWMNREAKARGYASINDLSQDDPAALTKMGAQWRQFHQREENGNLLQNQRANEINSSLYGDQKTDSGEAAEARGRLAGTSGAIGDAIADIGGSVRASGPSADKRGQEHDALIGWAQRNGLLIDNPPSYLDDEKADTTGGAEHSTYFDDKTGRWIKTTKGDGYSVGKVPQPAFGGFQLGEGTPLKYLQRLHDTNQLFGDDIRLHGVLPDGRIVTSQPDISGDGVEQSEIDSAMKEAGFEALGNGSYYRKSDNSAVFDLHTENAVKKDGVLIPFDANVVHPDEALKESIDDMRFQALAGKARASFSPDEYKAAADDVLEQDTKHKAAEPSPEQIKDIQDAYWEERKKSDFPTIKISNVMERAGFSGPTMELGKQYLAWMWKNGLVNSMPALDWVHVDDRARAWGMKVHSAEPGRSISLGMTMPEKSAQFSPEDTGAPEDGSNPGERLAREAEAANIPLRVADVVALMKMDPETTERIRARIAKATGKPARFSPDTQTSPQSANGKRFVPLASIQAQQRQRARAAQR